MLIKKLNIKKDIWKGGLYLFQSAFFLFLVACEETSLIDKTPVSSDQLVYQVNVEPAIETKAIPLQSAFSDAFDNFSLYAFHTTDKIENSTPPYSSFMNGQTVSRNGGQWMIDPARYWPQTGVLSFYAYAPAEASGLTASTTAGEIPTLYYTVPNQVSDQVDLMVAVHQRNLNREVVPITFKHALSCVSFQVGGPGVEIESIGISGVSVSGTLSLETDTTTNTVVWSNVADPVSGLYQIGMVDNPVANPGGSDVMAPDGYLMMIPQTLSSEAAILVKFAGLPVKTIPLQSTAIQEWKAGHHYVYSLWAEIGRASCRE